MTQTTQQTATHGSRFRNDEAVRAHIDGIVERLEAARAEITGVRPPNGELRETLDDYMKRAEASRGRGLMFPYLGSGVGAGPLVELLDGSVKYDMVCGIGPHFFGHSDPDLVRAALLAATSDIHMQGYFQQNADAIEFTETLVKEASRTSNLAHAFLCNSGAMANDNALKVCWQKNHPADRVLAFKDCFTGRSVAMCQIGDTAAYRVGVPITLDVDYMPFFDAAAAARTGEGPYIDMAVKHLRWYIERYPKQHAAFVFELVQGEGGYNKAPRKFFTALMDVCKAHGIAVWADEVQTFGRTEQMFAFEALGLGEYIDVCTIGKLSQVCAALYTEEYNPAGGLLSGTFLGGTVPLNVGRRMIERLREDNLYGADGLIAHHRALFEKEARALMERRPDWFPANDKVVELVGGFGGMLRLTPFGGEKKAIASVCKHAFEEGLIVLWCGHDPYHLRMLPPIPSMRDQDWPEIFSVLERAMERAAGERK